MAAFLTEAALARGLRFLSDGDADMARILKEIGPPPMWAREAGFHTLLHIILEQQVSLASARAAYDRLRAMCRPLTPTGFLQLDDDTLKTIGFSRQKTAYGRNLARSILDGRLDIGALGGLDDAAARSELIKIKGIGNWTADIYLLMALGRPDVWPCGDLALAVAVQRVKGLESRPGPQELEALGAAWQPWRAVAARLLWHYYLTSQKRRSNHPA
jgi:DNA-3-methyladenine glycosylase II